MRRQNAFTIVELLVVIAIVALLVSLLLPALQQARLHAEQTNCLSRMRGISTAMMSYVLDSREWYPPSLTADGSDVSYDYGGWAYRLLPYMGYAPKTKAAFNYQTGGYEGMVCPSRVTGSYAHNYPHWLLSLSWGLQVHSYKPNGQSNNIDPEAAKPPLRLWEITSPSRIMMYVDNGYYGTAIHPGAIQEYGVEGHPTPGIASPNHDGRGNSVGYVDCHAKFAPTIAPYVMDFNALWNRKSAWTITSWGYRVADSLQ